MLLFIYKIIVKEVWIIKKLETNNENKKKFDTINIDLEIMMDKLKELGSDQIKKVLMKHGI